MSGFKNMRPATSLWLVALLNLLLVGGAEAQEVAATAGVKGEVVTGRLPVEAAKVYAYELKGYILDKVQTDDAGRFLFKSLPAGVYKIIAFKEGFTPTVELLLRRPADLHQSLKLVLTEEVPGDVRGAEDYWQVRSEIPADVLRDLHRFDIRQTFHQSQGEGQQLDLAQREKNGFQAEMVASSGVEQFGEAGEARHSATHVGLRGAVGSMDIGIDGRLQRLESGAASTGHGGLPTGEVSSLAVQIEGRDQSTLSLSAARGETTTARLGGGHSPVDLEQYRLGWSGAMGASSRTDLSAVYQKENNFYQLGWIDPAVLPDSSETLDVQGTHARSLTPKSTLTAGLLYRQRQTRSEFDSIFSGLDDEQRIGLSGIVDAQLRPRVYIEYGLFSNINDGRLSLMPHGGIMVQLGSAWQAEASASQRIHQPSEEQQFRPVFSTAKHDDASSCQQAGEACYELSFTHQSGTADESITIGAIHREFAETLQVYFNEDFFHRLESVFLVEGDSVPELRFEMVRRIAPKVLARLQSNLASGGGGIFYATDDQAYENRVRYLVTSLDTLFQQTSTGIFIAFHHLEQDLTPVEGEGEAQTSMETQRLQLMLTQDLNILADVSSKWAFRVNMELSRGSTPYRLTSDQELYRKLTGGISVSF